MSIELESNRFAVGDADRAMGGQQDLLDLAVGDAFLGRGGAPGAQQFQAGLAALDRAAAMRAPRPAALIPSCAAAASFTSSNSAMLVLYRDPGREHSEDVPQDAELGYQPRLRSSAFVAAICGVVRHAALHGRNCAGVPVVLVKCSAETRGAGRASAGFRTSAAANCH